jgi:hypothetical protein
MTQAEAQAELARVTRIQSELPTPLADDRAALAAAEAGGDASGDVRATDVLRFRVARKAALALRADSLRAHLAGSAHTEL